MANIILAVCTSFLFIITAASAIESSYWWVRIWDFPRLLITFVSLVAFAGTVLLASGSLRWMCTAALLGVIGWQCYRIYPYTPLGAHEVEFAKAGAAGDENQCFKALSFNVLQDNRNFQPTIDMIAREDPDLLLLLETDRQWIDAVAPVTQKYPHKFEVPLDNLYGLAFYSRLPVRRHEVRYIAEKGTPSIFVWLETPAGETFHFIGLHPRPPQPGHNTQNRDGEIAVAAHMASEENVPVLAMGDFNDVAWSKTSQTFKRIGGYVDPRVGRGFYSTFPAYWPVFRWPLDHLFITPDIAVRAVSVLENTGSDHLPVTASLCIKPGLGKRLNDDPENPDADDYEDATDMIEKMVEEGESRNPDQG